MGSEAGTSSQGGWLLELVQEALPGLYLPELRPLQAAGGGLRVPGVGEENRVLPGHQGRGVGPRGEEAGGVKAVGLSGEEDGVQVFRL